MRWATDDGGLRYHGGPLSVAAMKSVTPESNRRRALVLIAGLAAAGLPLPVAAQAQRRPWPTDRPTPPLALPGVDAPAWRLGAARGRVVVLNFWASWCEPCRAEMPALELLAQRHESAGVQVVAVNFRESEAAIRRFTERTALTLPILRDADGAAARAFGVRVLPTTIVVGRDGRVAFSVVGEADWTGTPARQWVDELL